MEQIREIKTIYRFEYEDGGGIYQRRYCWVPDMDNERHPPPENDSLLSKYIGGGFSTGYYFGFTSLEQLRRWFYEDEHLETLHNKGVVIAEYICLPEDVLVGHTQAMFIREHSLSKTQHSISEYFNLEEFK